MSKKLNKFIELYKEYFSGELSVKKFIPGIAWFFILFALLCLPGSNLPPVNDWLNEIYFDKWVHAGLFCLLATLFMSPILASDLSRRKKWRYIWIITIFVMIWGYITELIQHYLIQGRSFDPGDFIADSFGAFLAIFICKKIFDNNNSQNIPVGHP